MPILLILVVVGGAWFALEDPELARRARGLAYLLGASVAGWWLHHLASGWLRLARYEARTARLRAFAGALPRGVLEGRGTFQGGAASVTGVQDGLPVRLVVRADPPLGITHEVWAGNSLLELDVTRPGLLDRVRGAPKRPRELELDRALARLLEHLGQTRVTLAAGVLRAEAPFAEASLERAHLVAVFRALTEVARLVAREEVDAPTLAGRTFAWTAAGGRARCPYCKDDLEPRGADVGACDACRTLHHRDCLAEGGGCTVLGCAGSARARAASGRLRGPGAAGGRRAARDRVDRPAR